MLIDTFLTGSRMQFAVHLQHLHLLARNLSRSCCLHLPKVEEWRDPHKSSDIQVKPEWESLGEQNGLPFHFTCLQHHAAVCVELKATLLTLLFNEGLDYFQKHFWPLQKYFPPYGRQPIECFFLTHWENLSIAPYLITERSKLLLAQHTVQLQYSSSIIFSVLRHLRGICKTCSLPSSQAGGIKQNQHGRFRWQSFPLPYSCNAWALPKPLVSDQFWAALCSLWYTK